MARRTFLLVAADTNTITIDLVNFSNSNRLVLTGNLNRFRLPCPMTGHHHVGCGVRVAAQAIKRDLLGRLKDAGDKVFVWFMLDGWCNKCVRIVTLMSARQKKHAGYDQDGHYGNQTNDPCGEFFFHDWTCFQMTRFARRELPPGDSLTIILILTK